MKIPLAAFAIGAVCAHVVTAAEIQGTVRNVTAKYATVVSNSNLIPNPGDKAQIYFKLPGVNVDVSVASGHVYEITGSNIMIQIDKATGTVAKDQLVRITSANPKKKSQANPPTATSASPGNKVRPGDKINTSSTTASPFRPPTSAPSLPPAPPLGQKTSVQQIASPNPQMTDLVNPAQKIVGTWQGPQHRKEFHADGTVISDPHLVPNPPRGHWSIKGDRLIQHFPNAPDLIVRMTSISDQELVTTDGAGHTFHSKRIPDDQAVRQAISNAARVYVVSKYASGPLPQPIVFKIEHLLVNNRFCNMEAVAIFKDGSNAVPKYMPDVVFNLCLERIEDGWRVVADLSRSDVPAESEIAQIRARLPSDFPLNMLSPTWRKLLNGEKP